MNALSVNDKFLNTVTQSDHLHAKSFALDIYFSVSFSFPGCNLDDRNVIPFFVMRYFFICLNLMGLLCAHSTICKNNFTTHKLYMEIDKLSSKQENG